jgi:hypothetical protein
MLVSGSNTIALAEFGSPLGAETTSPWKVGEGVTATPFCLSV